METKTILLKDGAKAMTVEEVANQFFRFIKKISFDYYSSFKNSNKNPNSMFTVDDIEQTAWYGLLKAYNTYSAEKNILFMTYMSRIAINEILMYLRKFKIKTDDLILSLDDGFVDSEGGETSYKEIISDGKDNFIDIENNEYIKKSFDFINEKEKFIVKEYFFNNKKQKQIADELNISQSYVTRIIKKSIKKIQKGMQIKGGTADMEEKKLIKMSDKITDYFSCEYLITKYKPFLDKMAWKYYKYCCSSFKDSRRDNYFIDVNDFYQIVSIGVLKAFKNYDISKNIIFYTYMLKMCQGEIKRYIRDTLGLRRKDYNLPMLVSMQEEINTDSDGKPEFFEDKIPDKQNFIEKCENKIIIEQLLSSLNSQEREIIISYYFDNKTQIELSKSLKISQAYVSRIISKSINKLNKLNKSEIVTSIKNKNVKEMHKYMDLIKDFIDYDKKNCKDRTFIEVLKMYCKEKGLQTTEVLMKLRSDTKAFIEIQKINSSNFDKYTKNAQGDAKKTTPAENPIIDIDKFHEDDSLSDIKAISNDTSVSDKELKEQHINPINKEEHKEIENKNIEAETHNFSLPDGLILSSLNVQGHNFEASISNEKITLKTDRKFANLSIEDLIGIRDEIDNYITLFQSL